MSLNRPFQLKHQGDDDTREVGSRQLEFNRLDNDRKVQWKIFASDLEDDCCDDPPSADATQARPQPNARPYESTGGGNDDADVNWRSSVSIQSLYMQQLMGAASVRSNAMMPTGGERVHDLNHVPSRDALPDNVPLRDWVAYYARNDNSHNIMMMGKRIEKSYLEKATRVALSLARKLEACYVTASANIDTEAMPGHDIITDNVIVKNAGNGDVELANFSCHPRGLTESEISDNESPSSGSQVSSQPNSQRLAIGNLGVIYYELFSQGSLPPPCMKKETNQEPSSDQSSFDIALQLVSEDDPLSDAIDGRRKQHRKSSTGSGHNHETTLQHTGLPPSICRLVSDMLENYDNESGARLTCSDQSVASLSDVVSDLQQMVDGPNEFLHNSFVMRFEPIIPAKLYGRDHDLRLCLEVSNSVSQSECNKKSTVTEQRQKVIMISGFSGCGKSSIVEEVRKDLEKEGWRCLQCKFDQEVRPQPLSTITSAFDRFLVYIMSGLEDAVRQEVQTSLVTIFDDGDINTLCHLIPTLRKLVPEKVTSPRPNGISFNTVDAAASKFRLHRLFVMLIEALSNQLPPLLFVMDDLQWADMASLELINSLVEGSICDDVNAESSVTSGGSKLLFVGCYRSEEFSCSDRLAGCIKQMRECSTIMMKEIHLAGLSSGDVNALVSDSLCYPQRLVRSLANLIHQKSAGSPLYVKEFLNSLATENLLTYSLSKHKWIFDEDLIQLKTVSDGVADILTRRLERLPRAVILELQVMSCLGSEVALETLLHVKDVCGNSDTIPTLDCAIDELLIKKQTNGSYCFVHDMIKQTIYRRIKQPKRVEMLKEIADALIAKTMEERKDAELFIIVDLINKVGPINTPNTDDRAVYAKLNLLAGEKSVKTPDFTSASIYIEAGISFLDDGNWKQNYSLTLSLFKNAALVHWALGKVPLMKKRIDEVLCNAKCFQDKLDSMNVLIRSLSISGNSVEKAYKHCLAVLASLGERFPQHIDDDCVRRELIDTNMKLQQLLPTSLYRLPILNDPQKKEAMEFLYIAFFLSYQQKSRYLPLVVCRMVRLTMSHGRCAGSSIGIAGMAICFARRNIAVGYQLGKVAVSLNKLPGCFSSDAAFNVVALVNIWKEPIQVLLPPLRDFHKIALKCGEITTACAMLVAILYRSFFSGSSLPSLQQETASYFRLMSRHKRVTFYLYNLPVSNAIAELSGWSQRSRWEVVQEFEDDDINLMKAFEKKDILLTECIITIQLMRNFIFRNLDKAERILRQYQEYFNLHETEQPVNIIYRTFYTGLIAMHCLRETNNDQYWMDIALHAIRVTEDWAKECKWNFENKAHLLKAEYNFALGNFDEAAKGYDLSISSAQSHRFVHEEAIANELAAYFHLEAGRNELSNVLLNQAAECYQSWGAEKKTNSLLQTLQN